MAHPDDECLWLSSVLPSAARVIFAYGDSFRRPERSPKRRRAVAALPLSGIVNLAIPESGAGFCVDWLEDQPETMLTPYGIAINEAAAKARYEANFGRLVTALRPHLAGFRDVCTHNPWGEYGHAEHLQVHRAVCLLQAELGFTIWYSNYVDARSFALAAALSAKPCRAERRVVPAARHLARGLMRVYRRHGAWTWTRWHRWPRQETLFSVPPAGGSYPLSGEVLLDVAGLRLWPPPWRRARHPLPLSRAVSSQGTPAAGNSDIFHTACPPPLTAHSENTPGNA